MVHLELAMHSVIRNAIRSKELIESFFWVFVALLAAGRPLIFLSPCLAKTCSGLTLQFLVRDFYSEVLGGILVLLFPIVFKLTFGFLPFQALRLRWRDNQDRQKVSGISLPVAGEFATADDPVKSSQPARSVTALAEDLAEQSAKLASDMYRRSGVYLLTGGLVAFSGLAFFYLRSVSAQSLPPEKVPDLLYQMLRLAPNFGILFFIEFIAFFFLKQYRSALDEYRYYEALKRCREENFLMLRVVEEKSPQSTAFEIIEKINLRSTAGKLQKDESTELLEARKLQKDEIEIIEKFVQLLGHVRNG